VETLSSAEHRFGTTGLIAEIRYTIELYVLGYKQEEKTDIITTLYKDDVV
jgi:hypothetical protein